VSDEWIDYEWRTAHQPNARYAPASFISGFLNSDIDLEAEAESHLREFTRFVVERDA
jgi:hypothetical protein